MVLQCAGQVLYIFRVLACFEKVWLHSSQLFLDELVYFRVRSVDIDIQFYASQILKTGVWGIMQ